MPASTTCSERRQPELVPAVLPPEDAQQEAVHAQQDAAPQEYGELLGPRVCNARHLEGQRDRGESQYTIHGRDDLALQSKLVAEAWREVAQSAFAVALHIRCFANVVEHVSAGKEQYGNQAERRP